MTPPLQIRLASEDDTEEVVAIDPVARRDAARKRLLNNSIGSRSCWVAEDHGTIQGYVVLEYTFYGNGLVPVLVVAEHFRRQGIGERLLLHAVSKCTTPKCFTSTNQSNDAMRAILAKTSFAPSGIIYNLDEGDPELVFVRRKQSA